MDPAYDYNFARMQQATQRNNAKSLCFFISFSGRMRRSVYFCSSILWSLFVLAVIGLVFAFNANFASKRYIEIVNIISIAIIIILGIYSCIYSYSLTWRRLQDTGRDGAFAFLTFIPYVGGLIVFVMCCFDSQPGDNQWGPNPKGVRGLSNSYPSSPRGLAGSAHAASAALCPICQGKGRNAAGYSCPECNGKGVAAKAGIRTKQPQATKVQVRKQAPQGTPAAHSRYVIHINGENMGPYSAEQLAEMVGNGQISPDTLVWAKGMPQWATYQSLFPGQG